MEKFPYMRICGRKKNGSSRLLGTVNALSRQRLEFIFGEKIGKSNSLSYYKNIFLDRIDLNLINVLSRNFNLVFAR